MNTGFAKSHVRTALMRRASAQIDVEHASEVLFLEAGPHPLLHWLPFVDAFARRRLLVFFDDSPPALLGVSRFLLRPQGVVRVDGPIIISKEGLFPRVKVNDQRYWINRRWLAELKAAARGAGL